jgi:hypothetical protein
MSFCHLNLSNLLLPVGLAGLISTGIIRVPTAICTSSPPFTNSLPTYPEISLVVLTNSSDCLLSEQSYTNLLIASTLPTNGAAMGALLVTGRAQSAGTMVAVSVIPTGHSSSHGLGLSAFAGLGWFVFSSHPFKISMLKPQVFSGLVCAVQTTDPKLTVSLGGSIT